MRVRSLESAFSSRLDGVPSKLCSTPSPTTPILHISTSPADGPTNMARDLELLEAAQQGRRGARLYEWDSLWVTLGRFQTPEEALLTDVPHVIRPTGGLAVVHGRDLTVAIATPFESPRTRSVKDVYRSMVHPIIEALNACGVKVALADDAGGTARKAATADCFATSAPFDIIDTDTRAKFAGCALRVTDRAALLQASIPYAPPLRPVTELLRGATEIPFHSWRHASFAEALAFSMHTSQG